MRYLIDTNILSEFRRGDSANRGVQAWFLAHDTALMAISVVAMGEIRYGIEKARPKNLSQAVALEGWLKRLQVTFANRILPVTREIADTWGRITFTSDLPDADAWMAATALEHDLTVVTRNIRDFERSGSRTLNPFTAVRK